MWYKTWVVINNSADTYEVFVQGGALGTVTQMTAGGKTVFTFRFLRKNNLKYSVTKCTFTEFAISARRLNEFMGDRMDEFPLGKMAKVLNISRSGFYNIKKRVIDLATLLVGSL